MIGEIPVTSPVFNGFAGLLRASPVLPAALFIAACGGGAGENLPPLPGAEEIVDESRSRAEFFEAQRALRGRVIDEAGAGLGGVKVSVASRVVLSDESGHWAVPAVPLKNALLSFEKTGYFPEVIALPLSRESGTEVLVPAMPLRRRLAGSVRMTFAGDTSFGRRFIDPEETTPRDQVPPDHPDALIRASDPAPGSIAAIDFVRTLFAGADLRSVNLETPVTDNPSTPHPTKDFAFFTLPGSLAGLSELGVNYVSLGNNHVYDYLDIGLNDTLHHLERSGIGHSGAGANSEAAFRFHVAEAPALQPYALLSMSSVSGAQHPVTYNATDSKGGAADLSDTAAAGQAIEAAVAAGKLPITQLHTGKEYTYAPSSYAASRLRLAVEAGAALVISHHPHIAQGFGWLPGRHGHDVLIAHGLGNFVFDQDRVETMLGLVAQVDMQGAAAEQVTGIPVYLEDYRPRAVSGRLADLLVRRIALFSRAVRYPSPAEGTDMTSTTLVYPYLHRAWVSRGALDHVSVERQLDIDVEVPASGEAIIDLRQYADSEESLSALQVPASMLVQQGRDLLAHGDFEDWDVDDDVFELERWSYGPSATPCFRGAYSGLTGFCSTRDAGDVSPSRFSFRHSIRVMGDATDEPNKDLSMFGYMKGENAGAARLNVRYQTSVGGNIVSTQNIALHPAGSYDWKAFAVTLEMPADESQIAEAQDPREVHARAVRLFFEQDQPQLGQAIWALDDLAVINWEESISLSAGQSRTFVAPHDLDFLKLVAPPGRYSIRLGLRKFRPAQVAASL